MKAIARQPKKRAAFTIVELLTVMSIIVILIGLLVPALNRVRIFAKEVKQKAQFHSIEAAIELFNNAFDGYPESSAVDWTDPTTGGNMYCGAMKLCEAMMGQDMLGFHTNSRFEADGSALYDGTVTSRVGPYLPPESADAVEIQEIWSTATLNGPSPSSFMPTSRVLCDVYTRRLDSGKKVGMPILYYKADTTGRGKYHDENAPMTPLDAAENIYNYYDNQDLLELGMPGAAAPPGYVYPLANKEQFYENTLSNKVTTVRRPFRADTYILISPGYDAEYGTSDDIMNFEWDFRGIVTP